MAAGGGGSGAGRGHVASTGTAAKVNGKTVDISAAAPDNPATDGARQVKVGTVINDDPNRALRATGAAGPGAAYDPADLNNGDLEMLPPARRDLVLRYFRSVRGNGAVAAPAPTQENK